MRSLIVKIGSVIVAICVIGGTLPLVIGYFVWVALGKLTGIRREFE